MYTLLFCSNKLSLAIINCMLSVFAIPREFKLRMWVRMWRRNVNMRAQLPILCWSIAVFSFCMVWCEDDIICKITKREQHGWNNTLGACGSQLVLFSRCSSLRCLFFCVCKLIWNPPGFSTSLSLLSFFLASSHSHLVSWLQQGLKRLQFISTHSGWRPHLVAAGNSISLPHTDEWVTTFRAPVNMCLLW